MIAPFLHFPRRRAAAAGGGDLVLTYVSNANQSTSGTTHTYSSVAIGSAAHVIIAVIGNATVGTVDSATVDGVSATVTTRASDTPHCGWIAIANPNPGASVTITATFSASQARSAIVVWAATNLGSLTPHATDYDETLSSSVASVSLNVPAGGGATAITFNNALVTYDSWSGLTEDVDFTWATSRQTAGASLEFASAQTPLSVSTTFTGTGSQSLLAAASWSKA